MSIITERQGRLVRLISGLWIDPESIDAVGCGRLRDPFEASNGEQMAAYVDIVSGRRSWRINCRTLPIAKAWQDELAAVAGQAGDQVEHLVMSDDLCRTAL